MIHSSDGAPPQSAPQLTRRFTNHASPDFQRFGFQLVDHSLDFQPPTSPQRISFPFAGLDALFAINDEPVATGCLICWPMDAQSSLAHPPNMSSRRWARRIERYCCTCATYFPLAFVYGVTTWAVWVVVAISSTPSKVNWLGEF